MVIVPLLCRPDLAAGPNLVPGAGTVGPYMAMRREAGGSLATIQPCGGKRLDLAPAQGEGGA